LFFDLLRGVTWSTERIRYGQWSRHFGRRLGMSTFGIIGFGRIGQLVATKLLGLGVKPERILVDDIDPQALQVANLAGFTVSSKQQIYEHSDVVSLHLPLTKLTKNMIQKQELATMKADAFVVNTSRGGIINEKHLAEALNEGQIQGAAVDVFEVEPYDGDLKKCKNAILTAHMGSMTLDCRSKMEVEAC